MLQSGNYEQKLVVIGIAALGPTANNEEISRGSSSIEKARLEVLQRVPFVRSFFEPWGQWSSLLWTPALRPLYRSNAPAQGIGRCVRCMCALRRVEEGTVCVSSLSGISTGSPLGVAYCLAKPGLAFIYCQPWPAFLQRLATWLTLLQRLAKGLNHICLLRLTRQRGWYVDAANQGISNGHSL